MIHYVSEVIAQEIRANTRIKMNIFIQHNIPDILVHDKEINRTFRNRNYKLKFINSSKKI